MGGGGRQGVRASGRLGVGKSGVTYTNVLLSIGFNFHEMFFHLGDIPRKPFVFGFGCPQPIVICGNRQEEDLSDEGILSLNWMRIKLLG